MCSTCDTSYDSELLKISFLKKHPSYLPYIGTEYRQSELKILHVGNCHYIEPSQDPDGKFRYTFFKENWFNRKIDPLPEIYDLERQMSGSNKTLEWKKNNLTCENAWNNYCLNTRNVVAEMLLAQRNEYNLVGACKYGIFTGMIKVLSSTVGHFLYEDKKDKDIVKIRKPKTIKETEEYKEKVSIYNHIAFTDFHMFPALDRSDGYVDSRLIEAAEAENVINAKEDAEQFYNDVIVKESSKVLDEIIKIINPDVIFITSTKAGEIFRSNTSLEDEHKKRIYCARHPNSIYGPLDDYKNDFRDFINQLTI